MFKNLTNFGYQRSGKEAFGFYIAYFFMLLLAAMILSAIASLLTPSQDAVRMGSKVGIAVGVISPLILSYLILSAKKQLGNFRYLFLGVLSGALGIVGGAFLAFIPVAFLTTIPSADQTPAEPTL